MGSESRSVDEIREEIQNLKKYVSQTESERVDIHALLENYDTKVEEIEKIQKLEAQYLKKAAFRGRLAGYSIASVLLGELGVIIFGTFFELSWDIMEPISYLMGLSNFTAGFAWYYLNITNPKM